MAKAKKLPSGNWRVRVYAGDDEHGKKIYKSFTAPTKREAEYLAAEYSSGRKKTAASGITLDEAMKRYIESKSLLSPSTLAAYNSIRRSHFQDIKHYNLSDLTQEIVQSEISKISASHSPKTVRNAHGLLSAVLDMFYPTLRLSTHLPQKQAKEKHIPTETEFKQFLKSVEGKPIEIPVLLAAAGSLRRSEIAALTNEDILDHGVRVNKAMVQGSDREWKIKVPKTTSSERISPLPPSIIQKIRDSGVIGTMDPGQISRAFDKAVRDSGVQPFTFHALRHYYASVLHAQGVPDKYIMRFGGWQTDTVLKSVYQHAMKDREEKEGAIVAGIFEKMTDE